MPGISEAIAKLTKTFTDQPEKARTKNSPATALIQDGLKFQVIGPAGEKVLTDMPAPMGARLLHPILAGCSERPWPLAMRRSSR